MWNNLQKLAARDHTSANSIVLKSIDYYTSANSIVPTSIDDYLDKRETELKQKIKKK